MIALLLALSLDLSAIERSAQAEMVIYDPVGYRGERVMDKKFAVATGLVVASTIFDVETRAENRVPAYLISGGVNGLTLSASYWLKKRKSKWWVLPIIAGGLYHIAGAGKAVYGREGK